MQHWHDQFTPTASSSSAGARNNILSTNVGGIFPSSNDWCHPTNIPQYMGECT
jgi:hypothetical protein